MSERKGLEEWNTDDEGFQMSSVSVLGAESRRRKDPRPEIASWSCEIRSKGEVGEGKEGRIMPAVTSKAQQQQQQQHHNHTTFSQVQPASPAQILPASDGTRRWLA